MKFTDIKTLGTALAEWERAVLNMETAEGKPISESFKRNKLLEAAKRIPELADITKKFGLMDGTDARRNTTWLYEKIQEFGRKHQEAQRRQQELAAGAKPGGTGNALSTAHEEPTDPRAACG